MRRLARRSLAWLLPVGLLAAVGCATRQRVSFECVPHEVAVYVDGRRVDPSKDVELDKDRSHSVFFKGGDYEPQMLVLESREVDGRAELSPPDVCSTARFVRVRPEIEMHVDPDAGVAEGPPGEGPRD